MDSNIKKGERSEKEETVGGEKEGEVWGKEEKWRKKKEEEEVLIGRGDKTKRIGIAARMWAKIKTLPAHGESKVYEKRLVFQLGGHPRWQNLPTARGS